MTTSIGVWALGIALCAVAGVPAAAATAAVPAPAGDTVHVLVAYDRLPPTAPGKRLVAGGVDARVRHVLANVSVLALELPAAQLAALRQTPGVRAVEEDPERWVLAKPASTELVPSIDNGLYGLVTTKVVDVHKRKLTGRGVPVCIVDEGLDAAHPDLAPNYAGGIDIFDRDGDPDVGPALDEQHGTQVAGVVAAALNTVGVRGVAYGSRFFQARVLPGEGFGRASDVMAGADAAVAASGCRVVNISIGGTRSSDIERGFYADLRARGVLVVASAGNDAVGPITYPGAYEAVVAVGAVDRLGEHAPFSQTGPELDLSAPGVGILTTVSRGAGEEAMVKAKTRYAAEVVAFAGQTTAAGVAAKLIDCGEGASAADFSSNVAGNLAFVRRGDAEPATQVENAMDAGAIGVVLYGDGSAETTLGAARTPDGRDWIPAVAVSSGTGTTLRKSLNKVVTMASFPSDWAPASGTSMAAPFVSGVAALMLQANPALSADELVEILEQTATPLGDEGWDDIYGWGLVNAAAAVRAAAAR